MDRSDVIELVPVAPYSGFNPFFDGGKNGLKPEYKVTMFSGDYNGEQSFIYNGNAYGVYRTYRAKTDIIELYTERKGGVNAKNTD